MAIKEREDMTVEELDGLIKETEIRLDKVKKIHETITNAKEPETEIAKLSANIIIEFPGKMFKIYWNDRRIYEPLLDAIKCRLAHICISDTDELIRMRRSRNKIDRVLSKAEEEFVHE
jgi:hypothetical protein